MNQEHERSDEEERSRAPLGEESVEWWRWIELCMLDGCGAGGGGLGGATMRIWVKTFKRLHRCPYIAFLHACHR